MSAFPGGNLRDKVSFFNNLNSNEATNQVNVGKLAACVKIASVDQSKSVNKSDDLLNRNNSNKLEIGTDLQKMNVGVVKSEGSLGSVNKLEIEERRNKLKTVEMKSFINQLDDKLQMKNCDFYKRKTLQTKNDDFIKEITENPINQINAPEKFVNASESVVDSKKADEINKTPTRNISSSKSYEHKINRDLWNPSIVNEQLTEHKIKCTKIKPPQIPSSDKNAIYSKNKPPVPQRSFIKDGSTINNQCIKDGNPISNQCIKDGNTLNNQCVKEEHNKIAGNYQKTYSEQIQNYQKTYSEQIQLSSVTNLKRTHFSSTSEETNPSAIEDKLTNQGVMKIQASVFEENERRKFQLSTFAQDDKRKVSSGFKDSNFSSMKIQSSIFKDSERKKLQNDNRNEKTQSQSLIFEDSERKNLQDDKRKVPSGFRNENISSMNIESSILEDSERKKLQDDKRKVSSGFKNKDFSSMNIESSIFEDNEKKNVQDDKKKVPSGFKDENFSSMNIESSIFENSERKKLQVDKRKVSSGFKDEHFSPLKIQSSIFEDSERKKLQLLTSTPHVTEETKIIKAVSQKRNLFSNVGFAQTSQTSAGKNFEENDNKTTLKMCAENIRKCQDKIRGYVFGNKNEAVGLNRNKIEANSAKIKGQADGFSASSALPQENIIEEERNLSNSGKISGNKIHAERFSARTALFNENIIEKERITLNSRKISGNGNKIQNSTLFNKNINEKERITLDSRKISGNGNNIQNSALFNENINEQERITLNSRNIRGNKIHAEELSAKSVLFNENINEKDRITLNSKNASGNKIEAEGFSALSKENITVNEIHFLNSGKISENKIQAEGFLSIKQNTCSTGLSSNAGSIKENTSRSDRFLPESGLNNQNRIQAERFFSESELNNQNGIQANRFLSDFGLNNQNKIDAERFSSDSGLNHQNKIQADRVSSNPRMLINDSKIQTFNNQNKTQAERFFSEYKLNIQNEIHAERFLSSYALNNQNKIQAERFLSKSELNNQDEIQADRFLSDPGLNNQNKIQAERFFPESELNHQSEIQAERFFSEFELNNQNEIQAERFLSDSGFNNQNEIQAERFLSDFGLNNQNRIDAERFLSDSGLNHQNKIQADRFLSDSGLNTQIQADCVSSNTQMLINDSKIQAAGFSSNSWSKNDIRQNQFSGNCNSGKVVEHEFHDGKGKNNLSLNKKVISPYNYADINWISKQKVPDIVMDNRSDYTGSTKRKNSLRKKVKNCFYGRTQLRSDQFLEPYFQGFNSGDRQSPGIVAPSPTPLECRNPFHLPNPPSRSPSRESLISSNGGSDGGSEDSGDTGYGAACDITLVERLIRSHPIWFLPGIQRAGAFHLLQGKEEGCFVVRQSSQSDTMALSVRLPPDKGPYIEHYLIQSTEGRLGLETSENRFDNMPALIAHYANCCDELPVQLVLPKAIREARSRQQLSSLALLGQEFWRYSPPPSQASSPDADLVLDLNPLMSTFKTAEPSTPVTKEIKPTRPNTLNLLNKIDPVKPEPQKTIPSYKNELASKQPPPPPPRWSKPTTPQSNITVTTTVTLVVNQNSSLENSRTSPETHSTQSTISSKGSLRRSSTTQILSPSGSILSPSSDVNSVLSPDTLSPLSGTKSARQSRRKQKPSKHYQESDILLDSPGVYNRSAVGDKVSDYEDVWTTENATIKSSNSNNKHSNFNSPDILQHILLSPNGNSNVLSPNSESSCSTPQQSHVNLVIQPQNVIQSPDGLVKSPSQEEQSNGVVKQGSPFYAEPADSLAQAVPRRVFSNRVGLIGAQQRHSNPPALHSLGILGVGLERMESTEFNEMSSSVDNLSPKQRITALKRPEVKAVMPPSLKPRLNDTWQLDNSWKFMGNELEGNVDSSDADYDSDWPATIPNLPLTPFSPGDSENRLTMQEMISKRIHEFRQSTDISTDDEMCRMSAYDNVEDGKRAPRAPPSEISEITEFSDPWNEVSHGITTETEDSFSENQIHPPPKLASISRSRSFKDRLDPLLCAPRLNSLRNKDGGDCKTTVGASIRNYALELADDKATTFAQNIDNFIACTCESKETNPQVVMRNMRQFMSGMKNYLVKHGEKGFDKEVERERNKLKSTEFLNLDAILEGVLHRLVVRPLKSHVQKLFVDYYTKTGAIRLLADNIQYASTRPITELAIKPKITLPSESALQTIKEYLTRLQNADSPLEKLEFLLAAIATIFNSVKTSQLTGSGRTVTLGADDFLPLFVWVLVKTKFVAAEIEAEYMWGLLHPSLLSGEGGYYLTTLSSAVHVLKNFKESNEENFKSNPKTDPVLKVVVPDELHGSILTKTLPARPHMTTKEVCKIIAHKARITNPQDFALYRLVDGEETMLAENDCPQDFMNEGKHVLLAYKRIDAKIAWPRQQQQQQRQQQQSN